MWLPWLFYLWSWPQGLLSSLMGNHFFILVFLVCLPRRSYPFLQLDSLNTWPHLRWVLCVPSIPPRDSLMFSPDGRHPKNVWNCRIFNYRFFGPCRWMKFFLSSFFVFFFPVASVNDAAWIHPQSHSRNNNNINSNDDKIIPPLQKGFGRYLGSHQDEYFFFLIIPDVNCLGIYIWSVT